MSRRAKEGSLPSVPRSKGCINCVSRKTRCGMFTTVTLPVSLPKPFFKLRTSWPGTLAPVLMLVSLACRWQAALLHGLRRSQTAMSRIPEGRLRLHERRLESTRRGFTFSVPAGKSPRAAPNTAADISCKTAAPE